MMSLSFKHQPKGTIIGTGSYIFRHYGNEAPVQHRTLIDPIDPIAFPNYTGLKIITLDGTEAWTATNGAVYTGDFKQIFQNQIRGSVFGCCSEFKFNQTTPGTVSIQSGEFILNGSSGQPTNGNLSFKDEHTTSASAWKAWLAEHPLTILISVNNPDASVWKPAKDSSGITGYWNEVNSFVAVNGGIPYYGDNLITQDVINNFYQAYLALSGDNRYWRPATDTSRTIRIDVQAGKYYGAKWDNTYSDIVGAVYRLGYTDNGAPAASTGNRVYNTLIGTPQDNSDEVLMATKKYMVVQVSGGLFPGNISHLSVREMIGYEPPAMLMAPQRPNPEPEPNEE